MCKSSFTKSDKYPSKLFVWIQKFSEYYDILAKDNLSHTHKDSSSLKNCAKVIETGNLEDSVRHHTFLFKLYFKFHRKEKCVRKLQQTND